MGENVRVATGCKTFLQRPLEQQRVGAVGDENALFDASIDVSRSRASRLGEGKSADAGKALGKVAGDGVDVGRAFAGAADIMVKGAAMDARSCGLAIALGEIRPVRLHPPRDLVERRPQGGARDPRQRGHVRAIQLVDGESVAHCHASGVVERADIVRHLPHEPGGRLGEARLRFRAVIDRVRSVAGRGVVSSDRFGVHAHRVAWRDRGHE